jgi:hypothetical protein
VNKVKASKKKKKATVVKSNTSVMHLLVYRDAEPIPVKGKGGAKVDPVMDLVSVNTYLKSNPEKMIVRCAGAEYGCTTTWGCTSLEDPSIWTCITMRRT